MSGSVLGMLGEVRDGSGSLGEFQEGSGCSGTVRVTLGEVRDGFGDLRLDPGRVGVLSWRSGTGRGVPKRFGAPSERSGTGLGNLEEVWDGSGTLGKVRDG